MSGKQQFQIFHGQVFQNVTTVITGKDRISQLAFLFLQFGNLFFDCVTTDQTVREDGASLSDAMRSVNRGRSSQALSSTAPPSELPCG